VYYGEQCRHRRPRNLQMAIRYKSANRAPGKELGATDRRPRQGTGICFEGVARPMCAHSHPQSLSRSPRPCTAPALRYSLVVALAVASAAAFTIQVAVISAHVAAAHPCPRQDQGGGSGLRAAGRKKCSGSASRTAPVKRKLCWSGWSSQASWSATTIHLIAAGTRRGYINAVTVVTLETRDE
jgi:hypothetical protein